MIAEPDRTRGSFAAIASPALFAALFDNALSGISLADARSASCGRYLVANPAFLALTGYDGDDLATYRICDLVDPLDLPSVEDDLRRLERDAVSPPERELRLLRRDGSSMWVEQRHELVRATSGAASYLLTHTVARRGADLLLRQSESRYRMIAQYAADMIVRTRADRSRSYVSPASKTLLGFEPHEIVDLDFAELLHPEDRARVAAAYDGFLAGGTDATHTYRLRHKNRTYVWVEAHWVAARAVAGDPFADGETAVIAIVRDVSERKASEAKIASLAYHDALTGLANRALFHDRLEAALALVERGGIAAVISIDLDDFKSVNDTLGHAVGDALLRVAAERLKTCVRKGDTVARIGGDEFAIVLIDLVRPDDATIAATRMLESLGRPFVLGRECVRIGASLGITTAPSDGTSAEMLLRNADLALYRAKDDGRNGYRVFDPEMELRSRARRTLELDLQRALVAREFCVFYQPIVDLASHAVVAFEALVRWQHPVRGLVPPLDFIAVAEETGAIVALGAWVLREAARTAATWPAHVRLCVNLSPVQFTSGDLVGTVADALEAAGLAAGRLDLEITESVLLLDNERTHASLRELRASGVGISLDDFGTGNSSLRYIRNFHFDTLKIDRSFVAEMALNSGSAAIVQAVIGIGASLGAATIAEGIETREQAAILYANGCTHGQGYLFSKPMPESDVAHFLRANASNG